MEAPAGCAEAWNSEEGPVTHHLLSASQHSAGGWSLPLPMAWGSEPAGKPRW